MTPKRVKDLVFVHSNLRLLLGNSSKHKEEELNCGILREMTFH